MTSRNKWPRFWKNSNRQMKKKTLLVLAFLLCRAFSFAQNSQLNQPLAGITAGDNFTYNNYTVSHYGLGWYYDPQFGPPMAYFSSFGGIKFFTSGVPRAILDYNGYLGIGTITPTQKLDVTGGAIGISNSGLTSNGAISTSAGNFLSIEGFNSGNSVKNPVVINPWGGYVGIGKTNPNFQLDVNGVINTSSYMSNSVGVYVDGGTNVGMNNNTGSLAFRTNGIDNRMIVDVNGNVGIGTTDTHNYKFAVNGDIHTKKVVVDLINWPDYVFKPTYNLKPLSEVKTYIDLNHHLPEMPSEKEITDKGLDLGEMNKLLTKKVEELTLYLIEKDKQIKDIQNKQQKQAEEFKAEIDLLKQTIKK